MLEMISLLPPEDEHQLSVHNIRHCIIEYPEAFAAPMTHHRTIARLAWQNMLLTPSGICPKHELQWSINDFWSYMIENAWAVYSVSNGSGPWLHVRVRVGTEPQPDWRSWLSIKPNFRFGYDSIGIALPVWIGRVLTGLYSGSICKYI